MPAHEYSPQEALDVLMNKLRVRDEAIAATVQTAIDAGKDASETEPARDRKRKARVYRKAVPFSHEEALQVALDALQAYFVEQPLFVEAMADSFAKAAIGVPRNSAPNRRYSAAVGADEPEPLSVEGKNEEKAVEIELQTATQISRTGEETLTLERTSKALIEQQRQSIINLRKMADFTEE